MSRYRNHRVDCKVYIGNLGKHVIKQDIEMAFDRFGPLKDVWLAYNPPGFAFVHFDDPRDATDAIRALNGTYLCGYRIRVAHSRQRSYGQGRSQFRRRSQSRDSSLKQYESRNYQPHTKSPPRSPVVKTHSWRSRQSSIKKDSKRSSRSESYNSSRRSRSPLRKDGQNSSRSSRRNVKPSLPSAEIAERNINEPVSNSSKQNVSKSPLKNHGKNNRSPYSTSLQREVKSPTKNSQAKF